MSIFSLNLVNNYSVRHDTMYMYKMDNGKNLFQLINGILTLE